MQKLIAALRAFLFAGLATASLASAAQNAGSAQGNWKYTTSQYGLRSFTYTATMPLLGKPTPVSVIFYCHPLSTKLVKGALGVDIHILDIDALKPFRFDDFDGPDALTHGKKLLQIAVDRPGKSPYVADSLVNGWSLGEKSFAFGISGESRLAKTNERSMLQMVADGADRVRLTLTDPKNAKLKLELLVPVEGKQAEFKALLNGLK